MRRDDFEHLGEGMKGGRRYDRAASVGDHQKVEMDCYSDFHVAVDDIRHVLDGC